MKAHKKKSLWRIISFVRVPFNKCPVYAYQSTLNTNNKINVIRRKGIIILKDIKKPKNQILIFDKFQCKKFLYNKETSLNTCLSNQNIFLK
jgi:hypothetical protein